MPANRPGGATNRLQRLVYRLRRQRIAYRDVGKEREQDAEALPAYVGSQPLATIDYLAGVDEPRRQKTKSKAAQAAFDQG